jgi:pyridoxine 5-phosphate synthase
MTRLSVNINKVALLRNSREGNVPNLFEIAKYCEESGAEGITVHPRPDERHIRYSDIPVLKEQVTTEFNIEGNPVMAFSKLVLDNVPDQVTLVPDMPDQLTSDSGWDTVKYKKFLQEEIGRFKDKGIRVSIFVDPDPDMVAGAIETGADRIELYTGNYAKYYPESPEKAIEPFVAAALKANEVGIGINAGHDLDLNNLAYFKQNIPGLLEVSIGHALIKDALYYGLKNTIQMYLNKLK